MMSIEESAFPVVCIQEYYIDGRRVDTTMFFTFDARYNEYVLWGKRGVKTDDPFMFRFDRFNDMFNFIDMSILQECFSDNNDTYSKNNKYKTNRLFHLTLYNYNNFPMDFDVSYDFLYDNMDESYEITGYENIKNITKSCLRKFAHICRHSYNRVDGEIV